ncbi:hypothetical protein C8Q79DRAFT_443229 [Trametes meyenii]|nr:hypothetical protein C8Q79DRAFT_443229 [Trametes meyenii]
MAMAAQFIQAGPGRSFSIPLGNAPPSPSAASPTSASFVANGSPRPYPTPPYRRASRSVAARRNFSNFTGDTDQDDRRSALVQSLNRSARIVFWYEPDTPPLRICQEITTFPFFSFDLLTEVVEKLSLSKTTYLDAYDPRTRVWEQQQVSVVRRIESEQRLLYRVRRGLFDGLRDDECPGLQDELALQEESQKATRKRAADQSLSPPVSKHHRSFSAQSYASTTYSAGNAPSEGSAGSPASAHEGTPRNAGYSTLASAFELSERVYPAPLPNIPVRTFGSPPGSPDQPTTAVDPTTPGMYSPEVTEHASLQDTPPTTDDLADPAIPEQSILLERPPGSAPAPTFASPAIVPPPPPAALTMANEPAPRRWPNDFFVYEIAAGLREMERVAKAEPALKQDEVFRRVFGAPYVKSTFCRHRALWRLAAPQMRTAFEERGRDEGAGWGEFARRVEGKGERARVAKARARAARAGVEEAVMGVPLQMLRGAGQSLGAAVGVGVVSPPMLGVMRLPGPMGGEEPVMGSLRPPEEERMGGHL